MDIVHDDVWNSCLTDATKMYRLSEPNEKCYKLAKATWLMKKKYKEHADKKKKNTIIFLDAPPSNVSENLSTKQNTCKATTMTGKRCSFKAVCGDFCRKHNIVSTKIGTKVDIGKIVNQMNVMSI
jgi:hypothetical protein